MDRLIDLSKTYLPTVAVVGIIISLIGTAVYFGKMDERIVQLDKRVSKNELTFEDLPTRREFDQLSKQMTETTELLKEFIAMTKADRR